MVSPQLFCWWRRSESSKSTWHLAWKLMNDTFIEKTSFVTFVHKSDPDHQRIVAASLVNSAYLLQTERTSLSLCNRSKTSKGWYEGVGFRHLRNLHEGNRLCGPILGAIFKYNSTSAVASNSTNSEAAPTFVIAFRGTANLLDILDDAKLFIKTINKTDRFLHAKNEVKKFVLTSREYTSAQKGSAPKLWIAGHSLGAAVAISVGLELIKDGIDESEFDTFLFNPPYLFNPPFQALTYGSDNPEKGWLNSMLEKLEKLVADLLKWALGSYMDKHLYGWAPRLYVHPEDLVCMWFIPFFEEKRNENEKDKLFLDKLTASDGSLVKIGWEWPKTLSPNYMRSAMMYLNRGERKGGEVEVSGVEMGRLKNSKKDDKWYLINLIGKYREAHSLDQWFDHKLHLEPQKYVHSSAATA